MTVLLLTAGMLAAALAVHLLWWRVRLPRNHTRTLLIVFAAAPAACLAALVTMGGFAGASLAEWALIALAYAPAALAYVVAYSIVENKSPTLDLVERIAAAPDGAAPLAALRAQAAANAALSVRLDQFAEGGVVRRDGETLALTRAGAALAALFAAAATLLGVKEGG